MNYRNISDSAAWPHTVIDHHTYLRLDETISPWACIEGFQIENVSFDILHNLFLGTARDLVASAISVLIRQHVYDHVEGNAESILGYIQREMARDCKSFGSLSSNSALFSCVCVCLAIGKGAQSRVSLQVLILLHSCALCSSGFTCRRSLRYLKLP